MLLAASDAERPAFSVPEADEQRRAVGGDAHLAVPRGLVRVREAFLEIERIDTDLQPSLADAIRQPMLTRFERLAAVEAAELRNPSLVIGL